jgi:hypothetical protein
VTGSGDCGEIRYLLGIYVLGAIDPAGRVLLEQHLARCHRCRDALAGLASLPALLGRVPAEEAYSLARHEAVWDSYGDLPAEGLTLLLGRVVRIRRQRKWRGAAAAAAGLVIVACGCVAAHRVLDPDGAVAPGRTTWTSVSARNRSTLASATVTYAPEPWGTELEVRVSGIPAGTVCQVWATNARGQRIAAGGWTIAAGQPGEVYPASTSSPASGLRGFQITASRKTLVTIPVATAHAGRPASYPRQPDFSLFHPGSS